MPAMPMPARSWSLRTARASGGGAAPPIVPEGLGHQSGARHELYLGISTLPMMYTVALAVCTLPQTTLAPLTV
jgi:hypothetical protein